MIFSVCSVKIVFPKDMILPFYQKSKDDLLPKIHLKMTFPISLKNVLFILENIVFLLIEKTEEDKVYSVKYALEELA